MSYRFGEWRVDPALNCLERGSERVLLEPQSMDILEYLLERPNQTVSRDEILDAVWPDRVVEPGAVARGIAQIRRALGDSSTSPRYIDTIRKRGYRAIAPVEQITDQPQISSESAPSGSRRATGLPRTIQRHGLLSILISLSAVLVAAGFLFSSKAPSGNAPSLAVLPFIDVSGDPDNQPLTDGITVDLILLLGAHPELHVVSSTSSFAFRNPQSPLPEIARTLGVTHILEGSVRRTENQVRIDAQLIDGESDGLVWSKSYERGLDAPAIAAFQKDLSRAVATSLGASQPQPRREAGRAPANREARDLYYAGIYHLRRLETTGIAGTDGDEAIATLERSMAADPQWAPPRVALARVLHFLARDRANLERARRLLDEAIRLDPASGEAYQSLGFIRMVEGDLDAAMQDLDRAQQFGAVPAWERGLLLTVLARYDEAVAAFQRAAAHDPLSLPIRWQLIQASYCAGHYDDVIETSRRFAASAREDDFSGQIRLANSWIRQGQRASGLALAERVVASGVGEGPLAATWALLGDAARAEAALSRIEPDQLIFIAEAAAPAAAILGNDVRAISLLEQALARVVASDDLDHRYHLAYRLRCFPEIRRLSGNSRFEAILRELGLEETAG